VASDGWVWECGWYGCASGREKRDSDRERQGEEINTALAICRDGFVKVCGPWQNGGRAR